MTDSKLKSKQTPHSKKSRLESNSKILIVADNSMLAKQNSKAKPTEQAVQEEIHSIGLPEARATHHMWPTKQYFVKDYLAIDEG